MWGPVNGEMAVLGWPRNHLKRAKKKLWTQRQGQTGSLMPPYSASLSLFPVLIFPFPLHHIHTVSPSISSFLSCHFLSPALSPPSPLFRWSFARLGWVSCHVLLSGFPAKRSPSRDTCLALAYWPGPRPL